MPKHRSQRSCDPEIEIGSFLSIVSHGLIISRFEYTFHDLWYGIRFRVDVQRFSLCISPLANSLFCLQVSAKYNIQTEIVTQSNICMKIRMPTTLRQRWNKHPFLMLQNRDQNVNQISRVSYNSENNYIKKQIFKTPMFINISHYIWALEKF